MPTEFASGSQWNRPPGVTDPLVHIGGATGGGGGGNADGPGGGAGAGAYANKQFSGLTFDNIAIQISSGGSQGVGSADGGDATDGIWGDGSQLKAPGGKGGKSGTNGGAGGLGGQAADGVGDVVFPGGNGGNGADNAGGGGGGSAGDTGAGGNGSDGASGVGGNGGSAGTGTTITGIGGNSGGDDDGDGGNGTGAGGSHVGGGAPGGAGKDDGGGDHNGGNPGDGSTRVDYSNPIIDVTTQPTNTNSGSTISTFTSRIKNSAGTPDTHASACVSRGNTCSIAWTDVTGSSSISTGTTTRAYGSGADGSKANFDDIVMAGGGTGYFTITDNQTGVSVTTSTITITAAPSQPFVDSGDAQRIPARIKHVPTT
jgi:hypothetical protein